MDPRIGLIGGFALQAVSGVWLMGIDLNVDTGTLMANSLVQGIAIGVIWVPLTLVTFSTIGSANLAEGTAVYHLLRNIGSSFFISICVAEIVRATSANYSRLVEMVNPYNRSLALPWVTGGWDTDDGRRPRQAFEGDQPAGGDAGLHQRLRLLHALLGARDSPHPVRRPPRPRALAAPFLAAAALRRFGVHDLAEQLGSYTRPDKSQDHCARLWPFRSLRHFRAFQGTMQPMRYWLGLPVASQGGCNVRMASWHRQA